MTRPSLQDNLRETVRKKEGNDDDLENFEKNDLDDENDKTEADIFEIQTQTVVGKSDMRSKLSNSQIIGASTQYLVSKLEETFDTASLNDSLEDDELLAKETQPVSAGPSSLCLQLDASTKSPLNNKTTESPGVSTVKENNPDVSLNSGTKIQVTRRSSINLANRKKHQDHT